jgi:hypothetical protein
MQVTVATAQQGFIVLIMQLYLQPNFVLQVIIARVEQPFQSSHVRLEVSVLLEVLNQSHVLQELIILTIKMWIVTLVLLVITAQRAVP